MPTSANISQSLLFAARRNGEHRLALVRAYVLAACTIIVFAFSLLSAELDRAVQLRAGIAASIAFAYSLIWLFLLRRVKYRSGLGYVSTTLDTLVVFSIIVVWSVYPQGLVPTQYQFGVGFGMLLALIALTGVRFDHRTVLLVTGECIAGYLVLLGLIHQYGQVVFVAEVESSHGQYLVNSVDVAGRLFVIAATGAILAFLIRQVERLLRKGIETTEQKHRLRQFISTNLIEAIESGEARMDLTGQRRKITLLFCDIRNFTGISEQMPAEDLLKMLNRYYELVAEQVFRHGGTLDKFMGDGVMVLFGAPRPVDNSSLAAVRCSRAMLERLPAFNSKYGYSIRIGVGLHTAEVVVGNLGTERYKNYTAVGNGVNVAARIEAATAEREEDLLVSAQVMAEIDQEFETRSVGEVALKGIAEPVLLFAVGKPSKK